MECVLGKIYFDEKTNNIFLAMDRNLHQEIMDMLEMLRQKNKQFSFARNICSVGIVLSFKSSSEEINQAAENYIINKTSFSLTKNGFVFCGDEELALRLHSALNKDCIFPKILCSKNKTLVCIPA